MTEPLASALVTAAAAHLLGFDWATGFVLGAIVSSTDAAAVFSVLTASGTRVVPRVAHLLELESGIDDPMAVILTTALTANLASQNGDVGWVGLRGSVPIILATIPR